MAAQNLRRKPRPGEVKYSAKIKGTRGNYNWAVQFDWTDGFLGIDQYVDDGTYQGQERVRVLLSPEQVTELIAFVNWYK